MKARDTLAVHTSTMSGAQDAAIQAAETLQSAHIAHSPDVEHDINPSTAASAKEPVRLNRSLSIDSVPDADEDEIPLSLLRPTPRRSQMPPLPDLRFEQSYLASIKDTDDWKVIAYITMKDQVHGNVWYLCCSQANVHVQVVMPLVQGIAWTLIVSGWRHWNGAAKFGGQTVGARIRRWWWGVNNWTIPKHGRSTLRDTKLAESAREFYETEFANAGAD